MRADAVNMVLLADELLGGDHKTIQSHDDSESSGTTDRETPVPESISLTQQIRKRDTNKYCSLANVSIVIVRGRP